MKSNYAKATKVLGIAFLFLIQTNVWAQLRTNAVQDASSIPMEQAKNSKTEQANNQAFENTSPFDAVKGLREDMNKRDAFSKHYINEDGSFTALIGAGPIHYERNGQFLDIDHTITQSSTMNFPFANTTNLMESYFGATVEYGVKSKTMEGEVVEFMNPTMYWEVNGQAMGTQQAANTQAQIQADKATYPNIYGDISAEYKVLTGKREMNYIIPNPQALGAVPAGADYLVFTEDVVLPFGWTSSLTETGIMIKDAMGQEIYLYENPHSTDAESHALREENTIFETLQIGNTLTIKTKVKTEWLLSNERVFPVMVDPTVNVYPTGSDYNTGSIDNFGTGNKTANADIYVGMRHAYGSTSGTRRFFRGWASFNLTNIPNNAEISNVTFGLYLGINNMLSYYGQYVRIGPIDSAIPNQVTGATLYNLCGEFGTGANHWLTISAGVPPGDVSVNFLQNQIDYVESRLATNIFSLGFAPVGSYDTEFTEQVGIYGSNRPQTTTNGRPYLIVTYTEPITDRTLTVSEAYTGASYANGSHTFAHNTSVTATSGTRAGYNIVGWEGTGSVPATGTTNSIAFNITQNSSIEWLWEAIQPEFHNYGGTEQLTFNNSKINTENPVFRLSHKGGTANGYQIQISNSTDFTSGTVSQTFTENYAADEENNFTFTNGSFTSGTTYYVRAAVDMGGGYLTDGWTTETYSFTYQSEQEIPDWFQTTQAQFESDEIGNVIVNANNGGEVITGAGGNLIVNGDFTSGNTNGWTLTGNNSTGKVVAVYNNAHTNYPGNWLGIGSSNTLFHSASGTIVVSQAIDLTNVSQITFNGGAYHYGSGTNPAPNTKLEFKIGGTLTDTNGNIGATLTQGSNNRQDKTVNVSSYTGVQVIKFVMTYNSNWNGNGMARFYIDDVVANAPPTGTITSTPIHLASVQDATGYDTFKWNQTPGTGDLKFDIQGSSDGINFDNISGYTDISEVGSGEKTRDISAIDPEIYPHLRLVGKLNGEDVTLHDWEVEFEREILDCELTTTWDGNDWSNGAPTESPLMKVIFEGDFDVDSEDLYACSVEVKTGLVVVSSGYNLIVENEVVVKDKGDLLLKDGANLVQINDLAVNSGNITAEKGFTFSTEKNQYNFVISPVINQNIKQLFAENEYKAQWYNEATNYFVFFEDGEYLGAGIGQAIQENQVGGIAQFATYYGEPHNGVITVSGLTNGNTRFQLAGNPYPSQLDLVQFYNDNSSNIESTFLFWDNRGNTQITQQGNDYNGSNYASFNIEAGNGTGTGTAASGATGNLRVPTQKVAVGNAFMLQLKTGNSYTFKNAQRVGGQGQNFLGRNYSTDGIVSSEIDRYWLTLNTPGGISAMNAVVYFDGGNDDFAKDDSKITGGSDDIYTLVDEHQLKIQGKSSFDVNDKIQLGYKAYAAGVHTISIYDSEGVFADGQKIFIRDFQTGIVHELTQSDFTFKTFAGEFNDRFEIFYKRSIKASENQATLSNVVIYQNENHIQIAAENQLLSDVEIYDLNGVSVYQASNINAATWKVPEHLFGKGILVVVVKTADGEVVNKKLINK